MGLFDHSEKESSTEDVLLVYLYKIVTLEDGLRSLFFLLAFRGIHGLWPVGPTKLRA